MALQNFGVSVNSDNQNLVKRLLKALTNDKSKENYRHNGFSWEFNISDTEN
jgi:hypothetical protein